MISTRTSIGSRLTCWTSRFPWESSTSGFPDDVGNKQSALSTQDWLAGTWVKDSIRWVHALPREMLYLSHPGHLRYRFVEYGIARATRRLLPALSDPAGSNIRGFHKTKPGARISDVRCVTRLLFRRHILVSPYHLGRASRVVRHVWSPAQKLG